MGGNKYVIVNSCLKCPAAGAVLALRHSSTTEEVCVLRGFSGQSGLMCHSGEGDIPSVPAVGACLRVSEFLSDAHIPLNCATKARRRHLCLTVTSLSLPERADVNFHGVSAACLHSAFWHFY